MPAGNGMSVKLLLISKTSPATVLLFLIVTDVGKKPAVGYGYTSGDWGGKRKFADGALTVTV